VAFLSSAQFCHLIDLARQVCVVWFMNIDPVKANQNQIICFAHQSHEASYYQHHKITNAPQRLLPSLALVLVLFTYVPTPIFSVSFRGSYALPPSFK
jgi:hypothetical protein